MWASVWRKNKIGAWARRAPPLNPPLQSAFQSVIRKVRKKDLVLELLSLTDSTGNVRLHYAPSICNVQKAKSTLTLLIVAYTYISGKPFSSPSIYQRYQQFYGAKPCKYELILCPISVFITYKRSMIGEENTLCKTRPVLDEGLSRPRTSTSFNEPGFHFSYNCYLLFR